MVVKTSKKISFNRDEFERDVKTSIEELGVNEQEARTLRRTLIVMGELINEVGEKITVERGKDISEHASELGQAIRQRELLADVIQKYELSQISLCWSYHCLKQARNLVSEGKAFAAAEAMTHIAAMLFGALAKANEEARRRDAMKAASIRHAAGRERRAEARMLFESREWRVKADAARAIERQFNVTYKTAERWVTGWCKT